MNSLSLDISNAAVSESQLAAMTVEADESLGKVLQATGAGSDFLGWVRLPSETLKSDLVDRICDTASRLRSSCDTVVCIGIGGSYLGAKAVIEALKDTFTPTKPEILFAGQNIGEDYLAELTDYLAGKRFGIIVISKSGTTTEPAIAFRLLKEQLERQIGRAHV